MIDDQVNLEELEESRKRRVSQETAAKNDMPVTPGVPVGIPPKAPKQWLRVTMKWLGAGGRAT
jgi:hypothetical protein